MLTEHDLLKMVKVANTGEIMEEEHTPIRKAYDATTSGVVAGVGAAAATLQGLKSLEAKGPVKTIV